MKTSEHTQEQVKQIVSQKLTDQIRSLEREVIRLKGQLEEMACKLSTRDLLIKEVKNESENYRVAAEKFRDLFHQTRAKVLLHEWEKSEAQEKEVICSELEGV